MAKARQPVSVGGVEFDALIDSQEGYESEVPAYPTEKGFSVTDTIIVKPQTLSLTLFITDTPVTWLSRHGAGLGRSDTVIQQLKEMYLKKEPVEVDTSAKVYENMAITSMKFSKTTENGYAYEVALELAEIVVTETKTVTIPDSYGKAGTTEAQAGTANTSSGSAGSGGAGGGSGSGSGSESGETTEGIDKSMAASLYDAGGIQGAFNSFMSSFIS